MKFITAFANENGDLIGCQESDMPLPANYPASGGIPISVGYVIPRQDYLGCLSAALLPLITVTRDGTGYTATLDPAARQYVTSAVAHVSTMAEIASADRLNPLVAHWLSARLHDDHEIKDWVDGEAAKVPHLAKVVSGLLHKRFASHELTPNQKHERNVRRVREKITAKLEEQK